MEEKIDFIKKWLGTGSINVFGLPMSGKDTVGQRLADLLGAKFLGTGMIIRAYEAEHQNELTGNGKLWPKDLFFEVILPYFSHHDLKGFPLVLSSMGRWDGEENEIMKSARAGNHDIKVVILLDLPESEVRHRWQAAKELNDRGQRTDDSTEEIFTTRIDEFKTKTLPVIAHYEELGLLVKVPSLGTREEVFENVVDVIYNYAKENQNA